MRVISPTNGQNRYEVYDSITCNKLCHCHLKPSDRISDRYRLTEFENDRFGFAEKTDFDFNGFEHIVGNGENADDQQFLFFSDF